MIHDNPGSIEHNNKNLMSPLVSPNSIAHFLAVCNEKLQFIYVCFSPQLLFK
jgi:hypothetical protein